MLHFKNDAGPCSAVPDAIGAILLETKGVQRIWLKGGGTFTVHGTHEEIVKQVEAAIAAEQLVLVTGSIPAGESY